jgi:jasmonate O-methyltransferase
MATEHLNRGRVFVSASGPAAVLEAYRAQFHADFLTFLGCRAAETRPRGLLLLTFVARRAARPSAHDCYLWDLLADALMDMAAAGLVDEDRVHSFNAPYYAPCPDDLARVVDKEGSFAVRTMQLFDTTRRRLLRPAASSLPPASRNNKLRDDEELPRWIAGETASTVRAVVEPMLRTHFGWDAMDGLFCRYRLLLEAYYRSKATRNKDDITNVFLVLEKKQH